MAFVHGVPIDTHIGDFKGGSEVVLGGIPEILVY